MAACIALLVSLPAIADDSLAGIGELIMTDRAAEARTRLTSVRDAFVAQGDRSGKAALREAQLSMLHSEVFESPRLWAAFSLHG
ncbi:MAG TPA: hypothetical protein VFV49_09970 [Thermoanaerobaculia bacterium]|nr:hypothetical protein [Thermoanaerobaculia bacterium]